MTKSEIENLLSYCPVTGVFTWKVNRGGKALAGSKAGALHPDGYIFIKVKGRSWAAHRLAFLIMTGDFPKDQVDHINMEGTDNRWGNLREASRSQNCVNRHRHNSVGEGFRGVLKVGNRYQAALCVRENGIKRRVHLGMFDTAEEANAAYLNEATSRYGSYIPTARCA